MSSNHPPACLSLKHCMSTLELLLCLTQPLTERSQSHLLSPLPLIRGQFLSLSRLTTQLLPVKNPMSHGRPFPHDIICSLFPNPHVIIQQLFSNLYSIWCLPGIFSLSVKLVTIKEPTSWLPSLWKTRLSTGTNPTSAARKVTIHFLQSTHEYPRFSYDRITMSDTAIGSIRFSVLWPSLILITTCSDIAPQERCPRYVYCPRQQQFPWCLWPRCQGRPPAARYSGKTERRSRDRVCQILPDRTDDERRET